MKNAELSTTREEFAAREMARLIENDFDIDPTDDYVMFLINCLSERGLEMFIEGLEPFIDTHTHRLALEDTFLLDDAVEAEDGVSVTESLRKSEALSDDDLASIGIPPETTKSADDPKVSADEAYRILIDDVAGLPGAATTLDFVPAHENVDDVYPSSGKRRGVNILLKNVKRFFDKRLSKRSTAKQFRAELHTNALKFVMDAEGIQPANPGLGFFPKMKGLDLDTGNGDAARRLSEMLCN